jgi:hypothetical protein
MFQVLLAGGGRDEQLNCRRAIAGRSNEMQYSPALRSAPPRQAGWEGFSYSHGGARAVRDGLRTGAVGLLLGGRVVGCDEGMVRERPVREDTRDSGHPLLRRFRGATRGRTARKDWPARRRAT